MSRLFLQSPASTCRHTNIVTLPSKIWSAVACLSHRALAALFKTDAYPHRSHLQAPEISFSCCSSEPSPLIAPDTPKSGDLFLPVICTYLWTHKHCDAGLQDPGQLQLVLITRPW